MLRQTPSITTVVGWIYLAQDRAKRRTGVNVVMNVGLQKVRKYVESLRKY